MAFADFQPDHDPLGALLGIDGGAPYDDVAAALRKRFNEASASLRATLPDGTTRDVSVGHFSTPSVAELRAKVQTLTAALPGAAAGPPIPGWSDVTATAYVQDLHATAPAGSVFQVSSQLNCLEFTHRYNTPEEGLGPYVRDKTQGQACALSCLAATAYRNYLVPCGPGGERGQRADRQLDLSAKAHDALRRQIGGGQAAAWLPERLWAVRNGYMDADPDLLAAARPHLDAGREAVASEMCVGVQQAAEVTLPRPTGVGNTQVFTSAVPIEGSRAEAHVWEPLARAVLAAAFEGTLLVAAAESLRQRCAEVCVFTTNVGAGAFGNPLPWVEAALAAARAKVEALAPRAVVRVVRVKLPPREELPLVRQLMTTWTAGVPERKPSRVITLDAAPANKVRPDDEPPSREPSAVFGENEATPSHIKPPVSGVVPSAAAAVPGMDTNLPDRPAVGAPVHTNPAGTPGYPPEVRDHDDEPPSRDPSAVFGHNEVAPSHVKPPVSGVVPSAAAAVPGSSWFQVPVGAPVHTNVADTPGYPPEGNPAFNAGGAGTGHGHGRGRGASGQPPAHPGAQPPAQPGAQPPAHPGALVHTNLAGTGHGRGRGGGAPGQPPAHPGAPVHTYQPGTPGYPPQVIPAFNAGGAGTGHGHGRGRGGAVPGQPPARRGAEVRVATINALGEHAYVRHCEGQRMPPELRRRLKQQYYSAFFHHSDVLFIQEADASDERILKGLRMDYVFTATNPTSSMIAFNPDVFRPIGKPRQVALQKGTTTTALYLLVESTRTKQKVALVNVHFPRLERDAERLKALESLLRVIDLNPDGSFVIGGDFNCDVRTLRLERWGLQAVSPDRFSVRLGTHDVPATFDHFLFRAGDVQPLGQPFFQPKTFENLLPHARGQALSPKPWFSDHSVVSMRFQLLK